MLFANASVLQSILYYNCITKLIYFSIITQYKIARYKIWSSSAQDHKQKGVR